MRKRLKLNPGVTWRQYAKARITFYIKLAAIQKKRVLVDIDDLKRWSKCMTVKGG